MLPENIDPHPAIDETSLFNGESYTILTYRDRHGREGRLDAIVAETDTEDMIKVLDSPKTF